MQFMIYVSPMTHKHFILILQSSKLIFSICLGDRRVTNNLEFWIFKALHPLHEVCGYVKFFCENIVEKELIAHKGSK